MTGEQLAGRFDAKRSGDGWKVKCPTHPDLKASLSIGSADHGGAVLHCFAGCDPSAVLATKGLTLADLQPSQPTTSPRPQIVAQYDYVDESGKLLYQAVRYEPKDFKQRRQDGKGGWIWNLGGVRRVLYRLDKLPGCETIIVVEGEKDADALWAIDLPATTNAGGADKWRPEYTEQLTAMGVRDVIVLPDNDNAGRKHAIRVVTACEAAGIRARVVKLPDLPDKGDVSDYLKTHTAADLSLLLASSHDAIGEMSETGAASEREEPSATQSGVADGLARETRILEEMERERAKREARRRLDDESRGASGVPPILTLRERLARPHKPIAYRIDNLQPADSRVMLAAQFKAGKTTLIGNLIRSLVDGDPFLGRYVATPTPGAVWLLDFEMSDSQLDDWLRAQCIRDDDRVVVVPMRGRAAAFDILNPSLMAAWANRMREGAASYLILDCLRPVLDAVGLDEHRDAGRFLVAFDALLADANITEAAVVHHMGHTGERARGDSRLRDWPDAEWRLVRKNDEPGSPRFLTAYGRDVDVAESQIAFDPITRHLVVSGGSRKDAKAVAALAVVIELLRDAQEPLSGREIKKRLHDCEDVKRDGIDAALKYGAKNGELAVTYGSKRAKLYEPCVRVSGSVRLVSGATSRTQAETQCPSVRGLIESRTEGHSREELEEVA